MTLTVTQFLRPDGRQETFTVEVNDALRQHVEAIRAAGLRFTAEVVPGNLVSLCIESPEEDVAIELATNGPGPNEPQVALERLICGYAERAGFVAPAPSAE